MRWLTLAIVCGCVTACGGSPGGPSPQPTPQPTIVALSGVVSGPSGGISGATVRITDGVNAGRTGTTSTIGAYRIDNLMPANANVFVSAACYQDTGSGVFIDGTRTLNFTLERGPVWAMSGAGDNVFDMPRCLARVRVVGVYAGYSSNFIVHVDGRGFVNELLGAAWGTTRYDGVLVTTGGVVEVLHSSGVSWSFTEVR